MAPILPAYAGVVSPRTNRRRSGGRPRRGPAAPDDAPVGPGAYSGPEQLVEWAGELWVHRRVTGSAATKAYRCPGCDHEIRPATPHVVAWPAETGRGLEDRRHWHSGCWDARERRRPAAPPR
jgi:hypothetical protein